MITTHYSLIGLVSVLLSIVHVECRCEKVLQTKPINVQGYRTKTILTNACKETSSAMLVPRVSVGDTARRAFIKRYQDSCCCIITSNTRHQVVLEPVAPTTGQPAALLHYRRIESCDCVRCSIADSMEDGVDIHYNDDLSLKR